jgi:hypothetical protein
MTESGGLVPIHKTSNSLKPETVTCTSRPTRADPSTETVFLAVARSRQCVQSAPDRNGIHSAERPGGNFGHDYGNGLDANHEGGVWKQGRDLHCELGHVGDSDRACGYDHGNDSYHDEGWSGCKQVEVHGELVP